MEFVRLAGSRTGDLYSDASARYVLTFQRQIEVGTDPRPSADRD